MTQTLILIIGAADTGRAPMTAALLRRMLVQEGHDWAVESAGVVGHDDDPAEPEARNAMVALGLDISFHRARSLTAELVTAASLLLAVDRGTARVLYARYPTLPIPITSLGEIAGTSRDIPDPFRMQVGAWISYAREIEAMLRRGLGRVVELVGAQNQGTTERRESHGTESAEDTEPHSIPTQHAASPMEGKDTPSPLPQGEELGVREPSPGAGAGGRKEALARCTRLLGLIADFPGVIEWPNAQRQLRADLSHIAGSPLSSSDMVQPYATMLVALVDASPTVPHTAQVQILLRALGRLHEAVGPAEMSTLMGDVGQYRD